MKPDGRGDCVFFKKSLNDTGILAYIDVNLVVDLVFCICYKTSRVESCGRFWV